MMKHATDMENLYSHLKKLVMTEPPDETGIKDALEFLEKKNSWFEKAEVRVGEMFNNLCVFNNLPEDNCRAFYS